MVVCDGLRGLPESITTTWSFAQVQTCVLHLIRNTFRYASKADWEKLAKDLRPVYTAVNADQAAMPVPFPAMALLTLVENAVRHGIDPSEEGGRIEVRVGVADGRCRAQVIDTGVGLGGARGTGTGLLNLGERLELLYGERASLRLLPHSPRGASAELEFPLPGAGP